MLWLNNTVYTVISHSAVNNMLHLPGCTLRHESFALPSSWTTNLWDSIMSWWNLNLARSTCPLSSLNVFGTLCSLRNPKEGNTRVFVSLRTCTHVLAIAASGVVDRSSRETYLCPEYCEWKGNRFVWETRKLAHLQKSSDSDWWDVSLSSPIPEQHCLEVSILSPSSWEIGILHTLRPFTGHCPILPCNGVTESQVWIAVLPITSLNKKDIRLDPAPSAWVPKQPCVLNSHFMTSKFPTLHPHQNS